MLSRLLLMAVSLLFALPGFAQIIYGVSPYYYNRDHGGAFYSTLLERLPELRELGVDILWLQPVYQSATEGQSYDVTDFFALNPAYGTQEELRALVQAAHQQKMRVIFDLPLNHSSHLHPYVLDIAKKKSSSKFYEFYQREVQGDSIYNRFLNTRVLEGTTYYHYFWADLLNFNYDDARVQKMAVDIVQFWINEFDIDGYRFDASWAPASRWPGFYPRIAKAARDLKPDAFLLAEDANINPLLLESGFNFSYDWATDDPYWLSKWSFQTGDAHAETVFNDPSPTAAARFFYDSLKGQLARGKILPVRYIENNDTGSFLEHHSVDQTKFASAVQFYLPGTPLLFYGQVEGLSYPQWHLPSLDPAKKLSSHHPELWKHYRDLIRARKALGAITRIKNLKLKGPQVSYRLLPAELEVVLDFKKKQILTSKVK